MTESILPYQSNHRQSPWVGEAFISFSLPGGGLNEGEDYVTGMKRELSEETGACNIRDIRPFGIYEEYRPWYHDNKAVMHMISYCYQCTIDRELGNTSFEEYEVRNGMKPIWIKLDEAIRHNEQTIAESDKKGQSIERETFLLRLIAAELM